MDVTEVTIIHHATIVLVLIWLLSFFNCCHPVAYFISLAYLFAVHERYAMRLRRKVQFEERRQANQKRVLSDSETVRWLNHAVEKIWPVCMEQIVSQKILLPIFPWFLNKYKPWTVKKAVVQNLYLGRSPPVLTEMRVLRQSNDDDHLVLELGLNFCTADDMSSILAVRLRKRLGFGMRAKMHLMGMQLEGKVLVGVKFLREWPFIGRLRVCFVEPPYFQMTVKPIFSHGLDVAELPGIAGWLDKLLAVAFEETLVEPNMLVVDVEKFMSPEPEPWFSVNAKEPIAYALVEVVEGSDMKPADLNGLADPYVKGQLGAYRFRTKTQRKTLAPKWQEEFKIPVSTWESPNVLLIEVRDKDHFVDDYLGNCSINIGDLRDGQRHDIWMPLQNIKMGRLHLAITVVEGGGQAAETSVDREEFNHNFKINSSERETFKKDPLSAEPSEKHQSMVDKFEPIDVEGQQETGIWVHRPGTEVPQKWEARKGKNRLHDKDGSDVIKSSISASYQNDSSSTDESVESNRSNTKNLVQRGLHKISGVFHRSPGKETDTSSRFDKNENEKSQSFDGPIPSPHVNLKPVNEKGVGINFVLDGGLSSISSQVTKVEESESPDRGQSESPNRKNVKGVTKSILKHAGKGIKHALSRKGSRNSAEEKGSNDATVDSDSTDDESLPLPVYKTGGETKSVLFSTVPAQVGDFFSSKEELKLKNLNHTEMASLDLPDRVVTFGESVKPVLSKAVSGDKLGVDSLQSTAQGR